ncbi:hypothetical protein [Streptomyces sp. NPDC086787]|uniref:hypothetical protein n=1 Tax=Streptomyces sp. NPDC086787 TaxID=3365759 RepID=UPI003828D224
MDSDAIRRRFALGTAALAVSGVLALLTPGSAQAADSQCAGRKVKSLSFSAGTVQIYRDNGYVCAVTLPKKPGARRAMSVSVQARGNRPVVDSGQFAYRAGPVKVYAGHRLVLVKGSVSGATMSSGWFLN